MQVLVTMEHRFFAGPDGNIWTATQFSYPFFHRSLQVFDGVLAVARVQKVSYIEHGWRRADGAAVSFMPLPFYAGPWQFAARTVEIRRVIHRAAAAVDAAILRWWGTHLTFSPPAQFVTRCVRSSVCFSVGSSSSNASELVRVHM
jgi:phosphatidylinositol alpha-1,6-mannosyltransferase